MRFGFWAGLRGGCIHIQAFPSGFGFVFAYGSIVYGYRCIGIKGGKQMKLTMNEFAAICGEYLIAPEIAMENEAVCEALNRGNVDALKEVLGTEF